MQQSAFSRKTNVCEGSMIRIIVEEPKWTGILSCTNTLIEQTLRTIDDLIDGKMICGAGGGGFFQVILKNGDKERGCAR